MGELKSGWARVKLSEVVENINDYFDRDSDQVARYVAGQHIDEKQLAVRRWGHTSDGDFPPTYNRRFQAGDVLYHSRNLTKLCCPDFEGVTGEKLFILRTTNEDRFLPRLLPFVLSTEHFDRYVLTHWSGSTNKFLNKTPLMKYEFALPPMEDQRRILDLLTKALSLEERLAEALSSAENLHRSLSSALFQGASRGAPMEMLATACTKLSVGIVVRPADHYTDSPDGVPALIMKNVQRGRLDLSSLNRITPEGHARHAKSTLQAGDVVAVRSSGSKGRTGDAAVVPDELDGGNCIDLLHVRPGPRLLSGYLCDFLNSPRTRVRLLAGSTGTMQKHLNVGALKRLEIPMPPVARQAEIHNRLSTVTEALASLAARREQARASVRLLLLETLEST